MISQVSPPYSGQVSPEQAHAPGFELNDIFRILTEQRRIILGVAAVGLILGIVASLLMTPLYRASATLEYNAQATELLETGQRPTISSNRAGAEALATQMGLLRSETLARRVVEDLNLASDPAFGGEQGTRSQRAERAVGSVLAGTTVEALKGSMLIQVHFVAADPALSARVANGIARGFIASSLERRYDSSSYARTFLSDQLARTKAALEESERSLNAYAIDAGVFRIPGAVVDGKQGEGTTMAATDLAALNEALTQAKVKRINAEQAYRSASLAFISDQVGNVGTLLQQKAELQSQYDEKLRIFRPDYPQMRELQARIDRIDAGVAGERSRISGSKRDELLGDYRTAERAEAQIAAQVAASKGEVVGERSRSIRYNILQRETDTNRALYDALLQRYKEIGVAGGIGQSNVSMVDQADPPGGPFSPKLILNALIGLVLGLGLGVAAAFAVHMLFDTVIDPADVRKKLHLPVLGAIPLESEDRTLMEALADRKSDVSEAYYSVRTALKFSRPEGAPRTLLVTSTRPGEGKSTSAYAIASSMARLGSKVLLIDADLRKPTFVSSRDDGYGLAHLLGSEESVTEYTEATQVENLHLLPVGRFVGSAAELLGSSRLTAIIAEAREKYEMIVLDGPPVLGLADAPLLGAVAEATALVVESRASRTSNVTEMVRRLGEAGANLIGVILTKVTNGNGGYGYNYYSYTYGADGTGGRVSSDPARVLDLGNAPT